MVASLIVDIFSVSVNITNNSMNIPIIIQNKKKHVDSNTLINSSAEGIFIDQNFSWQLGLKTLALDKPILAQNIDGTVNKQGTMKSYIDLEFSINGKRFNKRFYVTGLGKQKMILRLPWLRKHNPIIDWKIEY